MPEKGTNTELLEEIRQTVVCNAFVHVMLEFFSKIRNSEVKLFVRTT
jgi:hypothetical protein